jgi:HPt (histidine-containing phosphotransfer) domain-containing protein
MTTNKVETTIAYKLDARGLRDAKRELEKSFKPDSITALNSALKDARTRVKDLSAEYANAAKQTGAMAEFPKTLREGLRTAREEVRRLTDDLGKQLGAEQKLHDLRVKSAMLAKVTRAREQLAAAVADGKFKKGGAGVGRMTDSEALHAASAMNRGTAFRQGIYQGLGGPISQFMQRRDGATTAEQRAEMRSQFTGQMIGGAVSTIGRGTMQAGRTALNMGSAMAGGAGPMSTVLGSIPFLGGAAALAEGAVGSFVDRQRANLGALPFMGGAIAESQARGNAARAAVMRSGAAGDAGVTAGGRDAFLNNMVGAGTGARNRAAAMQEAVAGVYGKRPDADYDVFNDIRAGKVGVSQIPGLSPGERAEIANAARTRIADKGVAALSGQSADRAGQVALEEHRKATVKRADEAYAEAAGDPFAGAKAAVHGLMTGTEAIQASTAFTRKVGGGVNDDQFAQAFAGETLSGVDQGTSAALFKAQRAGRGGTSKNERDMLAKAIGAATAQGLEGSEIGEFLDVIASAQAESSQKGLSLDTDALGDMAVALSRAGLAGPQAGRVMAGVSSFAEDQLTSGVKGPLGIALMRSQGFDPSKGNFLETRAKLAGGMDAGGLFDFLKQIAPGEGSELQRGFNMESALRSGGINLGQQGGVSLANMVSGGKDAFMASIGDRKGTADELLASMAMKDSAGNATTLGQMTGGIRGQNAVQDALVGAGGAAAGNVQALQQQAASLASTLATKLDVPLSAVTNGVITMSKNIERILGWIDAVAATGKSGMP